MCSAVVPIKCLMGQSNFDTDQRHLICSSLSLKSEMFEPNFGKIGQGVFFQIVCKNTTNRRRKVPQTQRINTCLTGGGH